MSRPFLVIKTIDKSVQPWMDENEVIIKGEVVYSYPYCTYGCIGEGIAVTLFPGKTPFFEVPRDCVEPLHIALNNSGRT